MHLMMRRRETIIHTHGLSRYVRCIPKFQRQRAKTVCLLRRCHSKNRKIMPRINFQPADRTIEAEPGTSLLDAARRAGVRIRNDCAGKGVCGRCVVEVKKGNVHRLGGRFELKGGQVLACRALALESDLEVFVPVASREVTEDVSVFEIEALPDRFPPSEALVKRLDLELDPPSLEDNVCDFDRLCRALQKRRSGNYTASPQLLRELSGELRDCGWRPGVTLSAGECGSEILHVGRADSRRPCLLAVDVGTTSLKAELLAPGSRHAASCYNSQVIYGPDVISRIMYCQQNDDGLDRLQGMVVGDINRLLTSLLERAELSRSDVWACVTAGNTTMMHLLAGISPLWIRREPYAGSCYHLPPLDAAAFGIDINAKGKLYCLPSISGFVGADISAGVLATDIAGDPRLSMLIDLGTNGEIVLGSDEFMVCCSASAGPAFEGETSVSGTRAMPGAIETVRYDRGLKCSTIGDKPPVGICGSGYIDLLAVLMEEGIVNKSGKFLDGGDGCMRRSGEDGCECVVVPASMSGVERDIVITQADIDNLLRAKAALYGAANVLLESVGMEWTDLDRIMLAGAFGDKINKENAVKIGLMPDVERDRIEFVGNTSLQGVIRAATDEKDYGLVHELAKDITYFELSTHPDYMQQFMAAKFLPHTKTEQFPTVAAGT